MNAIQQKAEELQAKQKKLKGILDEAGDDLDLSKIKSLGENLTPEQKAKEIQKLDKELADIFDGLKQLQDTEKARENVKRFEQVLGTPEGMKGMGIPLPAAGDGGEFKSIGRTIVEHKAYQDLIEGAKNGGSISGSRKLTLPMGLKALFSEGTPGWPPQSLRIPGLVIPYATRPLQVIDILPMGQTTMQLIKYMEETTFTNASVETAEAAAYAANALALTERQVTVQKIASYLPVTDEQLADVPQAESYINQRLPFMIRQRLDGQVIVGNGTAPNLLGVLNVSGIQTYAQTGTDCIEDAIFKAMIKIRYTGFAIPSNVIFNPLDFQTVRLHRSSQGIYIWGNPGDPSPDRIWGVPIVLANALSQGTAVVGDFVNFSQLFERTNLDIEVGYINDDFIRGQKSIRADYRVAMVWYRPLAFCTATSLVAGN